MINTTLKNQIITKLEQLPRNKIPEVLDFIEFILAKSSLEKTGVIEATDKDILRAIETDGSLDFYFDNSQDIYTLEDGEPS